MMNTQDFTPSETAAPRSLRYWMRMTDALMAREVVRGFRAERATRRDLRILNALAGDAELSDRLRERLARGGSRVADLADRGWIARGEDSWEITPEGEAARARLSAVVAGVRQRTEQAVSAEYLATTRATLETLAREFGWTEDTRLPRNGRRHPWSGHGHRGHGYGYGHGRGFGHGQGFGHDAARGAGHERGHGFGHGHQGRTPDCTHDVSRGHGRGAADSRGCDRGHGGGDGRGHERGHGGYGSNGFGARHHSYERGFAAGFHTAHRVADPR